MTDAKLTVEDLDELAFPLEFARRAGFKQVTINVDHAAALIAAARASLDLQAYDELRRGGISVGAAQQAWHMAHAACGALGLIYEETAPADIAAAVYAESAPSAPSQPAESPNQQLLGAITDGDWDYVKVGRKEFADMCAAARELAARKPAESPWVAVSERLPSSNTERVLVAHRDGVMVSRYLAGDWRDQFNGRLYAVTHWMPLPAPPEPTNGR